MSCILLIVGVLILYSRTSMSIRWGCIPFIHVKMRVIMIIRIMMMGMMSVRLVSRVCVSINGILAKVRLGYIGVRV